MEEKQSYETQAYSLFIYLPATPPTLLLILMKRPQMTSFRVKLIVFGPTRLHFLPWYSCMSIPIKQKTEV